MGHMSALFGSRPVGDSSATASGAGAVAARGDIGLTQTGDGAYGVHIGNATLLSPESCPPAASVDCPPGLTNVPSRIPLFVGRDRELALLDEALAAPGQAVVHALHGLGGIGKSTLAARWATLRGTEYAPVWWITADSRAALDSGLAGLAAALQPTLVTLLPQEQLGEWARQWLASHTGWLLILDNVSDPADVEHLLARVTTGRCLITSRRSTGWRSLAKQVALDVLSAAEALDLFTRVRGEDPDAAALCAELGFLPLAVAQAAAYCEETGCTGREYLDDLAAYPAEMYEATDEGGDHERTVARVWHVTLDRLAQDPLAVRILLMLGWYGSEGIPRSLLASLGTPPAVRRALGRLAAHSMITLDDDTVAVHRLVQAVSRTSAEDDRHRHVAAIEAAREAAVRALIEALPEEDDGPTDWPAVRALLPHVEALAEHTAPEADTEDMASVFVTAAGYLTQLGLPMAPRAVALFRRVEAAVVRECGPDSEAALSARAALARALLMTEDPEEVVRLLERLHADCVAALGEGHVVTLIALAQMAEAAVRQGDDARARRLMGEVVAIRTRELGDGHRSTLSARAVLARYWTRDDRVRAGGMLDEVLGECLAALGPEDPLTLQVQSEQLTLSMAAGGAFSVAPVLRTLMGGTVDGAHFTGETTGVTAPDRALGADSAGDLFEERAPRLTLDVTAVERHLATCVRVFGDEDVRTLLVRMVLLRAYVDAGEIDRFTELFGVVEGQTAQALGDDHQLALVVREGKALLDQLEPLLGFAAPIFRNGLPTDEIARSVSENLSPEDLAPLMEMVDAVWQRMVNGQTTSQDTGSLLSAVTKLLSALDGALASGPSTGTDHDTDE